MEFLKGIRIHILAIALILIGNVAYFYPQLDDKAIPQGDLHQYLGMSKEARDYNASHDDVTLWTDAMFGGMPTYQIGAPQQSNISRFFQKLLQLFISRPIGYFISMMIGFYILMLVLKVKPLLALAGAVAFAWTTNHFVLFEAGHTSKLEALSSLPLFTAGIILLLRKRWLPGLVLFTIGLGVNIYSNHYQMTYYFILTLVVLAIVEVVKYVKSQDYTTLGKVAAYVIIGGVIAGGLSASKLLTTQEYAKDTMRGEPILKKESVVNADGLEDMSSSTTNGLSWPYAMQWSNGNADVIAMIIPSFVGGSSTEIVRDGSDLQSQLRRAGVQRQRGEKHYRLPLYWGKLPFTSGPVYIGAIMLFFFVLGLYLIKDPIKWWFVGGAVLTILLSYGKNLEFLSRFFFDYVPLYDKFRTPNSIMSITAFLVPVFGLMGVNAAMNGSHKKADVWKAVKNSAIITAGFCLLMLIVGTAVFNFQGETDAQTFGDFLSNIIEYRKSMMQRDAIRSIILILLAAGVIWALINEKIKKDYAYIAMIVLVGFDMVGIGLRYLNHDSFTRRKGAGDGYVKTQADAQILAAEPKGRGYYRVLDLSAGNPFSSARAAYFHNALNGYHAAKLQRIQDIIDNHFANGLNLKVLNMFNVRYIIDQKGNVIPRVNEAAGTAWFVNKTIGVNSPWDEINMLDSFNERTDAVVLKSEFSNYPVKASYDGSGSIELVSYEPNELIYETSNLSGEHFAVFPEVWYGPDKGWHAYIDDEPVEHIRVNYILRGMNVPSGEHTIRFTFRPDSYYNGETISLASSVIIVLLIGLVGFAYWKKPEWINPTSEESKSE